MPRGEAQKRSNSTSFKFFPQLNAVQDLSWTSSDTFLTQGLSERHFSSDRMTDKLVQALASADCLPLKELLESCEFFERIRKDVRSSIVTDLCCGHGLIGLLFAIFEHQTKRVILIDRTQPASHQKIFQKAAKFAPWIQDKVRFHKAGMDRVHEIVDTETSIVSSHACGLLTDACIETAIAVNGNIALMPCCYPKQKCPAPPALVHSLGNETAFDIHRTYRLEEAGYHVRWTTIPHSITPMNRVIVGRKRIHDTPSPLRHP